MISCRGMIGLEKAVYFNLIGLPLEINRHILYFMVPNADFTLEDLQSEIFSTTEKIDKFLQQICLQCPEQDVTVSANH